MFGTLDKIVIYKYGFDDCQLFVRVHAFNITVVKH